MRLRGLADQARLRLVSAGLPDAEAALDAELLLRHALGWDRATWIVRRDEQAEDAVARAFETLVLRRIGREPIAYIRGVQEFYGRDFAVGPAVLIPRPETELVVDEALRVAAGVASPRIADIGAGSGCLAVTLALEVPTATLVATDVSADAVAVARGNAATHGVAERVSFLETPFLNGVAGRFDLIVTNPPYVPESDEAVLAPEVVAHEPRLALFGGPDGMRDVRAIVTLAGAMMTPGGWLVMEIGAGQWPAVQKALVEARLKDVRVAHDLQDIPRVAVARLA
jgi:release factor glutamine methyltransferase